MFIVPRSASAPASFVGDQHSGWFHTTHLLLASSHHTSCNTQTVRIKPDTDFFCSLSPQMPCNHVAAVCTSAMTSTGAWVCCMCAEVKPRTQDILESTNHFGYEIVSAVFLLYLLAISADQIRGRWACQCHDRNTGPCSLPL